MLPKWLYLHSQVEEPPIEVVDEPQEQVQQSDTANGEGVYLWSIPVRRTGDSRNQTQPQASGSPYSRGFANGYDDGYDDGLNYEDYDPKYVGNNYSGSDRQDYSRGYTAGYRKGYHEGREDYEWEPETGEEDLTEDY